MTTTYRPSPTALLNPRMDANFKALFTDNSKESRNALKSFLEAILEVEVSDIELRPNELAEESEKDKQSRFDISCTLNKTEAVNIEMQGLDINTCFAKRAEYYVAHLLNHYTPRGLDWQEVPKVFQISILNFLFDETSPEALTVYTMRSDDSRRLTDRMNIIFVELPKMVSSDETDIDLEKLTPAQKWGKFLLYADKEDKQDLVRKLCKESGGIMDAHVTLAKISKDEAAWLRQTSQDIFQRDINSALRQSREQGITQGIHQGIAAQKAEDEKIIKEKDEEIARLKAILQEKE